MPRRRSPRFSAEPSDTLERIRRQVEPLQPPVADFQRRAGETAFEILISVLLSARTRDPVTEQAVLRLFARGRTPAAILALGEAEISRLIYPVGFYRQKAVHIVEICRRLFLGSDFPDRLETLTALPGVGRKTANLVLSLAFHRPSIAVDTHVFRISRRLGWASGETPRQVEEELRTRFPVPLWSLINQTLVGFGQTVCRPVRPRCPECAINDRCRWTSAEGDRVRRN